MEQFHQISMVLAVILLYVIAFIGVIGILAKVSVWSLDKVTSAFKIKKKFIRFMVDEQKKNEPKRNSMT